MFETVAKRKEEKGVAIQRNLLNVFCCFSRDKRLIRQVIKMLNSLQKHVFDWIWFRWTCKTLIGRINLWKDEESKYETKRFILHRYNFVSFVWIFCSPIQIKADRTHAKPTQPHTKHAGRNQPTNRTETDSRFCNLQQQLVAPPKPGAQRDRPKSG